MTILETLADYAPVTKDPTVLTEYVRAALGSVRLQRCFPRTGSGYTY